MNWRGAIALAGITVLGLAIGGVLQHSFAQSNPLIGAWKLNISKSKFSSRTAPPRNATLHYQQDGQNFKNTAQTTDALGNSTTVVYMHIYDGQPHPTTGASDYDASAYTRVDANTVIFGRFKAGKLIATGTITVSPDGETNTVTTTGAGSSLAAATASPSGTWRQNLIVEML
jgi:hypothetical protein